MPPTRQQLTRPTGPDFALEPRDAQIEVLRWLRILEQVMTWRDAGKPTTGDTGCFAAAARLYAVRGRDGELSPKIVQNKFYAYERARKQKPSTAWRALIDRARHKAPGSRRVPQAFLDWWDAFVLGPVARGRQHGRRAQAYRELIARWERWRAGDDESRIPGYATPPEPSHATGVPFGWQDLKARKLPKMAALLTAQGERAASQVGPHVHQTRVGIKVGQVVEFDDQHYDVKVSYNVSGYGFGQDLRPVGLNALDYASGCDNFRGYKPQLVDATGTRRTLNADDALAFVIAYLCSVGYRPDTGTTLVMESGTMAVSSEAEERIVAATGGAVRIVRSAPYSGASTRGLIFAGATGGNYRFKARREGWFGLLRTRMAGLPGATGRNRDEAPEEAKSVERYCRALMEAAQELPPERRALLMLPLLGWTQFVPLAEAIVEKINARTDHEMEGWAASGYLTNEIQVAGQWVPAAVLADPQLTDAQRLTLMHAAALPNACRVRNLSPAEVWRKHSGELTTLPDHAWPFVMPQTWAREFKHHGHEIIIRDQEVCDDKRGLRFFAQPRGAQGFRLSLETGHTYLAWYNPFVPDRIQVSQPNGAWLGTCHRREFATHGDVEALQRQFGDIAQVTATERYLAADAVKSVGEVRRKLIASNARVLDTTRPLTPSEHQAADALTARHASLAALLATAPDDAAG